MKTLLSGLGASLSPLPVVDSTSGTLRWGDRGMCWRFTWGDALLAILGGSVLVATLFPLTLDLVDLFSPLLGQDVHFSVTVSGKPDVCVVHSGELIFEGKVCAVYRSSVYVFWDSLTNNAPAAPGCGTLKSATWRRTEQTQAWAELYLGSCGSHPDYFDHDMPSVFNASRLFPVSNFGDR